MGTRWPDEDIAAIDTYAAKQDIDRAEAIRRLTRMGLLQAGKIKQRRKPQLD